MVRKSYMTGPRRARYTGATAAWRSNSSCLYDVDATPMRFQRHERGIHALQEQSSSRYLQAGGLESALCDSPPYGPMMEPPSPGSTGTSSYRWPRATSGTCWPRAARRSGPAPRRCRPRQADFAPVVTQPGKVICVGLNYRSHILETGRELPEYPTLFAKFAETLTGPRDDLVHTVGERAGRLGGRARRRHRPAGVPGHAGGGVGGYRRVHGDQRRVDAGLAAAHACSGWPARCSSTPRPAGPYLVTPDEVGDAADLEVRCEVDGAVMQQSRTSDLLFVTGSDRLLRQPGDHPAARRPDRHRHLRRGWRCPQAAGLPAARQRAAHLDRGPGRVPEPVRGR